MALTLNASAVPFVPALQRSASSAQLNSKDCKSLVITAPKTDPMSNRRQLSFNSSTPVPQFTNPTLVEMSPFVIAHQFATPQTNIHHYSTSYIERKVLTPMVVRPIVMPVPTKTMFINSPQMKSPTTQFSFGWFPLSEAEQLPITIPNLSSNTTPEVKEQRKTNKRADISRFINFLIEPLMKDFINNQKKYDTQKSLIKTLGYSIGTESGRRIFTSVMKSMSSPEESFIRQLEDEILNISKNKFLKSGKKVETDIMHSLQSYDIAMTIAEDWNNLQMMYSSIIPMGISSTYVSCKRERGEIMSKKQIRIFVNEMMINYNSISRYGIASCIHGILSNMINHLDFVDTNEVEKLVMELEQKSKISVSLDISNHLIDDYFPNHKKEQLLYDRLQQRFLNLLADAVQNNLDIFKGSMSDRQRQLHSTGFFHSIEYLCSLYPQLCGLIYIQPFSLFTQ